MINLEFYFHGQWVRAVSDPTMPVLNPATEAQTGSVVMGNSADVDKALATAKAAFARVSQTCKADRLDLLRRLKTALPMVHLLWASNNREMLVRAGEWE